MFDAYFSSVWNSVGYSSIDARKKIVSKTAGRRTIYPVGLCGGKPRINTMSYEKYLPNYRDKG